MAQSPRELPDGREVVRLEELYAEWWGEYMNGLSTRTIAETYGVARGSVQRGLQDYLEANFDDRMITMARNLDLARLEALMDSVWTTAIESGKPAQIKLAIKVVETRARILGYSAPKKVEHSGHVEHGVEPALAGLLERLHERNAAVRGSLERPPATSDVDIVDAEIVDDDSD